MTFICDYEKKLPINSKITCNLGAAPLQKSPTPVKMFIAMEAALTPSEPPTENQILSNWGPSKECLVSICMLSYNHGKYIENTLKSILNQKTDFGFEILIHDDASTDGSQEIIKNYHKRYPTIIKPIIQTTNQWSKGVNPSIEYNYPRANAEYVAWCECDDMWIDNEKLSIQISGMQAHTSINMSFHPAIQINYGNKTKKPEIIGVYSENDAIISFSDIIHRPQGMIPTASCIVRQKVKNELFEFMKTRPYMTSGDVFMQLFGARPWGAIYYAKPMSVYRISTEHSLTRGMLTDTGKHANHQAAVIRAYIELNDITQKSIARELKTLITQRIFWLFNRKSTSIRIIEELNISRPAKVFIGLRKKISEKAAKLNSASCRYVIYGCGSGCALITKILGSEKISCIIDRDNKKTGEELFNKPIESIDNLNKYTNHVLIVSTLAYNKEAIEHLARTNSFPLEKIHYFFEDLVEMIDIESLSEAEHSSKEAPAPGKKPPGWWIKKTER